MNDKIRTAAREIFGHALDLKSPQEREAYLTQACAQDAELRRQVYQMAGSGAAAPAIAYALQRPLGEVELLMALRRYAAGQERSAVGAARE